jgi:hypothetical protein
LRAEIPKIEQFLKHAVKSLVLQVDDNRETHLTVQNSEGQLKSSMIDALNENPKLQASQKQLLQKAKI